MYCSIADWRMQGVLALHLLYEYLDNNDCCCGAGGTPGHSCQQWKKGWKETCNKRETPKLSGPDKLIQVLINNQKSINGVVFEDILQFVWHKFQSFIIVQAVLTAKVSHHMSWKCSWSPSVPLNSEAVYLSTTKLLFHLQDSTTLLHVL